MNENVPLTNVTIGCCVCVCVCVCVCAFGARYDDEGYRNKNCLIIVDGIWPNSFWRKILAGEKKTNCITRFINKYTSFSVGEYIIRWANGGDLKTTCVHVYNIIYIIHSI